MSEDGVVMRQKIDVIRDDIDGGIPGDSLSCAVALACNRIDGFGDGNVVVEDGGIYWGSGQWSHLPEEALDFIDRFDELSMVERSKILPISFEVEIIPEVP